MWTVSLGASEIDFETFETRACLYRDMDGPEPDAVSIRAERSRVGGRIAKKTHVVIYS
jgi:hypothetical protein